MFLSTLSIWCWGCRGWRPLLFYTGLHILALFLDQLPLSFVERISDATDYVGLFKSSSQDLGWPEGIQTVSLIALFILVNSHP